MKTQWKLTEAGVFFVVTGVFFVVAGAFFFVTEPLYNQHQNVDKVKQYVQWWEEERPVIVLIHQEKSVEPPLLFRVIMDFLDCVTVKRSKQAYIS